MSLSAGARLGSYAIVTKLGAGGMGEVYRARDAKLDRDVAIKVLSESWATDPEAFVRFEREARIVAAISHPNILAIFDFGVQNGVCYAVTELLEGETLRSRLDAGALHQKQAVDYAVQVAHGLSAAHERGIVHRDLKPENLFITRDGLLKILDFGLAKREAAVVAGETTGAPTASAYTAPGVVMGTLEYMSPEQVRGLPADSRSDVFSFGAVFYELLSGKKAFKRETAADTMAAIIKEEPPELSESGRGISPALEQIVKHCLEKRAEHRFQSARDLAFSLVEQGAGVSHPVGVRARKPVFGLWPAGAAVALVALVGVSAFFWRSDLPGRATAPSSATDQNGRRPRLVVLPFENLGEPDDAYFSAGITEEIISRLANLQGLAVISRTTAIGYNRRGKSIRQVGSDLGVDYVLEGTIRWERGEGRESRLRITPVLIRVDDDTHLWGDRYDRVLADIFAIQSEVAQNVVRAMGMKLVPREQMALVKASTSNIEAYDFYLRGLELAGRSHGAADTDGAIRMFEAAVARDRRFPAALAELAKAHLSFYFYFDRFKVPPDRSHVESARKVLDSFATIGEDLPELRVARGYYTYWGFDRLEPALVDFNAARALQPNSIPALSGALFVLRRQGRWKEAGEVADTLFELDPQNTEILQQLGMTFVALRQYRDADRVYGLSTKFNRQYGLAWGQQTLLQLLMGDTRRADQLIAEARAVEGLVDDFGWVEYAAFRAPLLERDFPRALRAVNAMTRTAIDTQWFFVPAELMRAEAYAFSTQSAPATQSFQAARRRLEGLTAKAPKDSRYRSALAIAYAGLGLRSEALREAKAGVDLMPPSTDAWRVMWRRQDLARVHAMLGNQDDAIEALDGLLGGATELSAQLIRLDPRWDSLRSNPRFQTLLAKYDAKP
jgi:serine/threonine protein kinase/tetratricopeptide (TPR) repeat protein